MKRMKKTGRPLVLTINGKAEAVCLIQSLINKLAEHLDVIARIRPSGPGQERRGTDGGGSIR